VDILYNNKILNSESLAFWKDVAFNFETKDSMLKCYFKISDDEARLLFDGLFCGIFRKLAVWGRDLYGVIVDRLDTIIASELGDGCGDIRVTVNGACKRMEHAGKLILPAVESRLDCQGYGLLRMRKIRLELCIFLCQVQEAYTLNRQCRSAPVETLVGVRHIRPFHFGT